MATAATRHPRRPRHLALCTPTLVSKGFMQPEDICLVDLEGNQLAGTKNRTSEILMHLQIMQCQPRAVATCHCHPPSSTGFAVAGVLPPTQLLDEFARFIACYCLFALDRHAGYRRENLSPCVCVSTPTGNGRHNSIPAGEPGGVASGAVTTLRTLISKSKSSKPIAAQFWPRSSFRRSRPEAVPRRNSLTCLK